MPRITVGTENSAPIEIHYEDHGSGDPGRHGPRLSARRDLVGTPGTGAARERLPRDHVRPQGFGRSSQPTVGYDYNTFAADLNDLLEHLNLDRRRPRRILDGLGRGHAVPRNVRRQSGAQGRAARRDPPFLLQTEDNPEGVDQAGLRGHQGGDRQRPLRVLQGLLRQLLQRRQAHARTDQRARRGRRAFQSPLAVRRSPHTRASTPGSPTSDAIYRRSSVPVLVSMARRTESFRTSRPRRACRHCSTTSSSSRSTARPAQHRLDASGRGQQRRCSSSSPAADADGGPAPSGGRGRRRLRWPPMPPISFVKPTSTSRSSTARTTISFNRCSTRSRPESCRKDEVAPPLRGILRKQQERPRRSWPRSPASISRTRRSSPSGRLAATCTFPYDSLIVASGIDDLVLRTRRVRQPLAPDEDDRRHAQPAPPDLCGVRAGRVGAVGGGAPEVAHLRRRRRRARRGARSPGRSPSLRAGRCAKDFRAIDPKSAVGAPRRSRPADPQDVR